jgi:glycosyltransferase involved in cell wall biosynthesis
MGHPWTTIARFLIPHKCSVYTLHDPIYHPGTPLLIKLAGKIERLKTIDSYVILSKTFVDYTKKHYGKSDKDIVVIPHGAFSHYDVYSNDIKPFFSLAKYNFLFFGRITKYKGLELLIEAYRKLAKERDDISLRVIGSGDISEYKRDLEACPNTIVENRYVCDNEVHSFFSMPNTITVIPYTSATQSGVIPIAMHEKSLIISTNNEGLMEQTKDGTLALVADISVDSFNKADHIRFCSYRDATNSRAFLAILFTSSGVSTKNFIALKIASSSRTDIITPFSSGIIISLLPFILVTIEGNPIAPASKTTFGTTWWWG